MIRCMLLVFFVLLNSFVMLFSQLLLTSFTELYVHSQVMGHWKSSSLREWYIKYSIFYFKKK